MKAFIAIVLGFALLLAPLWTLSGFVTVPQYRTGTMADYSFALIAGATLYGGVILGMLIGRRRQMPANRPFLFKKRFKAGMAGAMGAITLTLIVAFLGELVSTGRLMPAGQTPALLPIFYVVGGVLAAVIAAGAAMIAYGLAGATTGNESE